MARFIESAGDPRNPSNMATMLVASATMSIESAPSQKTQANSEYAQRINRVIDYLRGNLDRQVKLEELAKKVATATDYLIRGWLINSDYEPEHAPGLEIFLDKENAMDWSHFELELCIPVRKLAEMRN